MKNTVDKRIVISAFFAVTIISFCMCMIISLHQVSFSIATISDYESMLSDIDYSIDHIGTDKMKNSGRGAAQKGAGYKFYSIRGWCADTLLDKTLFNTKVLLKKTSSENKFYVLSTEMVLRDDLKEYGKDRVSLQNAGFIAKIEKSKLPKGKYDIYLMYGEEKPDKLVKTEKVLEVS